MTADRSREAEQAFRRGDLDTAERLCGQILAAEPNSAPATLLKGMVAVKRHRLDEAERLLKRALELSPNDYVAIQWLIGAYYEAARYGEAIELGRRAHALWPDEVEFLIGLSHAHMMKNQDIDASVACLEKAVKLKPGDPVLRCKLGAAYESLTKDHEAHCEYLAAIDAAPQSEEAYSRLARLFMTHGNYVEALETAQKGLAALPGSAQMHLVYAQSLRHLREFAQADQALEKAIELDPRISLSAAKWLEEDGRFEQAVKLFRKSIELKSNLGSAYYGIVRSRKMVEADRPMLGQIERLLEGRLSLRERAAVHYALGKAANDLGDYGQAMHHFDEGNAVNFRLHLSGKPYNRDEARRWRDKTIAMVSPETLEKYRGLGSSSEVPIFIVGMIRSGTTLTEQIIASHPEVGGGGEQRYWLAEAPGLVDLERQILNEDRFTEVRDRYLAVLRGLEPDASRVTDKMPTNYFVVWLIYLAFPNAKIIHVKRSPIDTALSIYMTDLAKPPEFAHSKRNIVDGYRDYQALMSHFEQVIPRESMMTIRYEDLVEDQETWTRRMLEFCGLPWSGRCLEFHTTDRQVTTPSRWQVRQPIYRSSMEKWRRYEPWLGEFAELLKDPEGQPPESPRAREQLALGQAQEKAKRNRDAVAAYREAIRLNPKLGDAYDRVTRILLEDGRFGAALQLCEQAFAVIPEYGQIHLPAAQALLALHRKSEAEQHVQEAVQLDPNLAWVAANWLQSCGRVEAAESMLAKSIEDKPIQGRAYLGLVKGRKVTDRSLIHRMEALSVQEMPPKERAALLRALGKASDDVGEYQAAMGCFDAAAELGIRAFGAEALFEPTRLEAARESFLRLCDKGFWARYKNVGVTGYSPIFVLGMIRSGTTLVNQILTSHPNIGDAGEQPFWTTAFPSLVDLDRGDLKVDAFVEARDRYLELLKRFDSDSPVVSNKWPMNYAHAGLLLLAYPDAKIVHVQRDPVDTALSIYMTDLGEPRPEFSYRKRDIVAVYRDCQTRMRHWERVLSVGSIFTVRYEDLVGDQEAWSRRLIEFCGQEWDDRCLAFHETERRVNTPSMLQVRQPIYGSSVGKWRHYEPWLGELAALRRADDL